MWKSLWTSGIGLMLLAATAAGANDAPQGSDPQVGSVRVGVHAGIKGSGTAVRVEASPVRPRKESVVKPSDHWLGLRCYPAPAVLRTQLDLPENQGLVAEKVFPNGPAAKAGIKKHDVLVRAGDKPLGKGQDLVDAVQAAKETELPIELIRGGKPQTITAVPVKRPWEARSRHLDMLLKVPDDDRWWGAEARSAKDLLRRLQPGDLTKGPMRLRFFHPRTILPHDSRPHPPLPGNVSITIHRQGDKPAEIIVQEDDGEELRVTEEDLGELPENIQAHVERMLGHPIADPTVEAQPSGPPSEPEDAEAAPADRQEGRLENRLDEIRRRIDALQESLDELRQRRSRPKKAPQEDPDQV